MRGWRKSGLAAAVAGLVLLAVPARVPAQPPGFTPECDQYDPNGPTNSARITLDSDDLFNEHGQELRSFIDTGSIGKVDVSVVTSSPAGIVQAVSAVPEISRYSPDDFNSLRGVAVSVAVGTSRRPVRVVLNVRQVCARHFRNTFLYF